MNYEVVLELLFIFIIYSIIGWILEVTMIAIKEKKFVNRGILNGPFCTIYGTCAVVMTLALDDANTLIGIFFGSLIYATVIEFMAGKILERINKNKWWDYSKKKFNLDGYICLQYSLLWGILGLLAIKIFNPIFLFLFNNINIIIRTIIIFSCLGIFAVDFITSFITLKNIKENNIEKFTDKFGNFILKAVKKRMEAAYPILRKREKREKNDAFASGIGFYKLFLLFIVGAFIGDIIEIFFCRYTMGYWMSRSSLVWGQFSLVWGLALVIATILLNKYQDRSNTFLFIFGTITGGAFEYACSVFTEFFFGSIFWDYSGIPFNIHGRVNLLYCFFWGFATIIYIKWLYPKLSNIIESIPKKAGVIITNILFCFIVIDLIVTGCVMLRYTNRLNGEPATNIVEELCDKYADDEFMQRRWQNMKFPKANK